MDVNSTIELLDRHYVGDDLDEAEKIKLFRKDIIEAVKFDLGDEFTGVPKIDEVDEEGIPVPKLPYDKVYFEAVSQLGLRFGALFENYGDVGVCGQLLAPGVSADGKIKGLAPAGVAFFQDGEFLAFHHAHDERLRDLQVEAMMVLNLMVKAMAVLNCSNVIAVDSPEKKWINEKRKKKGKLPLYTYKTLHIVTGEKYKSNAYQGGTHASPRVHLRRGHIRKCASGKTVWVQPCVVGDKTKGMVDKDYAVHS